MPRKTGAVLWLDQSSVDISRKPMSVLATVSCSVMTAISRRAEFGTVIEEFQVRDRINVRCYDEIAGAKRSRDQFKASRFFNGERNRASIRIASEKPSFNMTRARGRRHVSALRC
jgi:hypothetical protein